MCANVCTSKTENVQFPHAAMIRLPLRLNCTFAQWRHCASLLDSMHTEVHSPGSRLSSTVCTRTSPRLAAPTAKSCPLGTVSRGRLALHQWRPSARGAHDSHDPQNSDLHGRHPSRPGARQRRRPRSQDQMYVSMASGHIHFVSSSSMRARLLSTHRLVDAYAATRATQSEHHRLLLRHITIRA